MKSHKNSLPLHLKALQEVIEYCGNQNILANELGISRQCINNWLHERGKVSLGVAMKIEHLTKGKFKYTKFLEKATRSYLRNIG